MIHLERCIDKILCDKTASSIAVKVGRGDEVLYETYRYENRPIDGFTLFDMASVTKIMAPASLCLIAVDRGLLDFDTKVSEFFHVYGKDELSIFHILTHTTGVGPKALNLPENNRDNIADFILRIPQEKPLGSEVQYNCQGFVLLAKILENVFSAPLDVLFKELVCKPLGMERTTFCPSDKTNMVNSNKSDSDIGIVNDENSRHLGGIAGNAGVFSCINDLTRYVRMLLAKGNPIISEKTFKQAVKNYTGHLSESRGLGFLYVDERYKQTGELFPEGSFGHCGHTGQSVFVDPVSGLYVIVLSDATISTIKKYGEDRYANVMLMREEIHNAIKADLSV